MARVTKVEHAQRNYTADETNIDGGIKKGQSYYWWKFRYGGKRFSLTPPKPQQLTQSAFYSTMYDIGDQIAALSPDDSLQSDVPDIISALEELRDETQGSLDNMPEGLQQGSTGELLQERIDGIESALSELEGIDLADFDGEEFEAPEQDVGEDDGEFEVRVGEERDQHTENQKVAEEEHWQGILDEVQGVDISIG